MTRNEDITEPFPLCRGEHGVKNVNRPPVGKEVSLLVPRPGVIAKVEIVIDLSSQIEVVVYATRETCCLKEVLWYLTLAELCTQRGEEAAGLRSRRAGKSIGFPNV
jgi:hypothetical protein